MTEQLTSNTPKVEAVVLVLNLENASEELRASLVSQACQAVALYPLERRKGWTSFNAFVYLVDPQSERFFIGDLEGTWDRISSISIHHVYTDKKALKATSNFIQSVNPGVLKFASPQFIEAFEGKKTPASEVYVPNWVI